MALAIKMEISLLISGFLSLCFGTRSATHAVPSVYNTSAFLPPLLQYNNHVGVIRPDCESEICS